MGLGLGGGACQVYTGLYVVIALLMLLHQFSFAPHHPSYQWPDAPGSVYRLLDGHNVALSRLSAGLLPNVEAALTKKTS